MDEDTLKEALLQHIRDEAEQLADTLCEASTKVLEDRDPKSFEENFAQAIRSFGARLLGRSFEAIEPEVKAIVKSEAHARSDAEGTELPLACTGSLHGKGTKRVSWDSTLGPVPMWRETTACQACGRWLGYLDVFMEITAQGMTPALSSAVALAGTCEAYESSSRILRECLGQEIDDNRIRATVLEVAARAAGWVTLSGAELEQALELLPQDMPITVYVGVDGGRVQLLDEGWKEPCEGVIWWTDASTGQRVRIALGDVNDKGSVLAALDRWMAAAQVRHPHLTLVIIADGAEWIWCWAKKHKNAIKILDYYHLKEHLWETANALYGAESAGSKKWVEKIMNALWEGRVQEVLAELKAMTYTGSAKEVESKQEAVRQLSVYLENHQGLIDYAQHRALHLNIGSGTVESTCKQLFNMRLKGPGMRWSRPGAQAVIHLRCLHITGRWRALWQPRHALRCAA